MREGGASLTRLLPPLLCGYHNYLVIATDKLTLGDA